MYRFLCDQMLFGLGRWLRAAGYDTSLTQESIEDSKIFDRAVREKRLLLTRDKHFLGMTAADETVIHLCGNTLDESIHQLNTRLNLDWLYQPFSRCLKCNTTLMELTDERILQQVPERIRIVATKFCYCRDCRKVFWEGSHTRRMYNQLLLWQTLKPPEKDL